MCPQTFYYGRFYGNQFATVHFSILVLVGRILYFVEILTTTTRYCVEDLLRGAQHAAHIPLLGSRARQQSHFLKLLFEGSHVLCGLRSQRLMTIGSRCLMRFTENQWGPNDFKLDWGRAYQTGSTYRTTVKYVLLVFNVS
jgi:hypothetical protein